MTSATPPKLLLIGLGDLGSITLEFMAREPSLGPILVGSRNANRGERRVNLTRLGAIAQGCSPSLRFLPVDLDKPQTVIGIVRSETPDIILSTAVRQTWWLIDLLPPEHAARLRQARFGVCLPIQLSLSLKLMRALRAADYRGVTLTAPFPDVVNAVLGKIDLAPTCGVGNVDEVAAKVRWLAAERLRLPVREVKVQLVAHHALEPFVFDGGTVPLPPHYLRLYSGGRDVTADAGGEQLLRTPYHITGGPATNFLTAGSIARLIRALGSDEPCCLHAPAPRGLPGGYPVVVRRGEIKVAPMESLSLDEAIMLNEASHRWDGIEHIKEDGTVVFRAEDVAVLREELGYEVSSLAPNEADDRAHELMSRLREFARKAGVDLDLAWQAARLSG